MNWIQSSKCEAGACVQWRRAIRCGGGDCVEFRKSSYSMQNGNCVEVGSDDEVCQMRDSKLGDSSPILTFSPAAWLAFLDGAKSGEFDLV